MSTNETASTINDVLFLITLGLLFAFVLNWQQISFLKKDCKLLEKRALSLEMELRDTQIKCIKRSKEAACEYIRKG